MPLVASSAMYRVEYDAASRRLDIWFSQSGRYSYFGVQLSIYEGLLAATSKGQYFNSYIREQYA
ncbi:KTSC domain-containing protein [Sphingomonas sp. Y38-1Y]|uniref:KTSC domain-containing protein n=1 Tax=Sphingomonas sp. Y38-1Y TaxID=3078265 RepID=UPI0028EE74D1|nr:KTSC domain-containing protein [Sphingomonas sp. Y38-1Y]